MRRAVDIGIENADAPPLGGQRQRQVDRGGRLAHPALAGRDGNDVLHIIDGLQRLLHRMSNDLPADLHVAGRHSVQRLYALPYRRSDGIYRPFRRKTQLDRYLDLVTIDGDVRDRLPRDQISLEMGLGIAFNGFLDLLSRH